MLADFFVTLKLAGGSYSAEASEAPVTQPELLVKFIGYKRKNPDHFV